MTGSEQSAEKVCIVGAGSSGIVAAKVLDEHGIDFDCLEMGDSVGGNWVFNNSNQLSSVYRSTFINTSKWLMQYSDYPMPAEYPPYPHHTQIAEYFNNYVDHFGIRDKISFNTKVELVEPADGVWRVTTSRGVENYRAVLVANGHHWSEKQPDFPGHFDGDAIHSHRYRSFEQYEDKRVLVVGIGNSAVDIASEVSRVAEKTFVSTRHGAHVVPKFIGSKPLDRYLSKTFSRLPLALQRFFFTRLVHVAEGKMSDWGLPEPDHRLLEAHPTISSEFLHQVSHGRIEVKPNVEELCGREVAFVDGSREPIDKIVFATGYKIDFPFLPKEVIDTEGNQVRLYRHVVDPQWPTLYFVGLVQPLGAIMPIAELQSIWITQLLRGELGLPSREVMERAIDQDLSAMQKRYVKSSRHTIQVDFYPYLRQLKREMKRAKR